MRILLQSFNGVVAGLDELVALARMYEGLSPPGVREPPADQRVRITYTCRLQLRGEHAEIMTSTSPYFEHASRLGIDVVEYCNSAIPEPFWALMHKEHLRWHPAILMSLFRRETFIDTRTSVLFGGPHGARWMVLALIRIINALSNPVQGRLTEPRGPTTCLVIMHPYLEECVDVALQQFKRSVKMLQRSMAHRLNVRDTPLIFQSAERTEQDRPLSPYDPRSHAGEISYDELYI